MGFHQHNISSQMLISSIAARLINFFIVRLISFVNWCYICQFQRFWELACLNLKQTFNFSQMNAFFLTILTGKNYAFTQFSTRIY